MMARSPKIKVNLNEGSDSKESTDKGNGQTRLAIPVKRGVEVVLTHLVENTWVNQVEREQFSHQSVARWRLIAGLNCHWHPCWSCKGVVGDVEGGVGGDAVDLAETESPADPEEKVDQEVEGSKAERKPKVPD